MTVCMTVCVSIVGSVWRAAWSGKTWCRPASGTLELLRLLLAPVLLVRLLVLLAALLAPVLLLPLRATASLGETEAWTTSHEPSRTSRPAREPSGRGRESGRTEDAPVPPRRAPAGPVEVGSYAPSSGDVRPGLSRRGTDGTADPVNPFSSEYQPSSRLDPVPAARPAVNPNAFVICKFIVGLVCVFDVLLHVSVCA